MSKEFGDCKDDYLTKIINKLSIFERQRQKFNYASIIHKQISLSD